MSDTWVVNASPVITLAKADHLHLLEECCREVLLPEAVVAEILAGPIADPARQAVESGWGRRSVPSRVPSHLLEWGLGTGENSVLALAAEGGLTAVLDDAAAHACAKALGIEVIGTLGVVLRAKKKAIIPAASDVLGLLQKAGLYLEDDVIRSALATVGERWK